MRGEGGAHAMKSTASRQRRILTLQLPRAGAAPCYDGTQNAPHQPAHWNSYNLANAMLTEALPSQRWFTWTYSVANRAAKLAGAPSGGGTRRTWTVSSSRWKRTR